MPQYHSGNAVCVKRKWQLPAKSLKGSSMENKRDSHGLVAVVPKKEDGKIHRRCIPK
jgi:hypothetical protein